MASNKIAQEIMQSFSSENYQNYVQKLSNRDSVDVSTFPTSPMGEKYWIDVRSCLKDGESNPDHILELFERYSDKVPKQLRETAIQFIAEDAKYWAHTGAVVLQMNSETIESWLSRMSKRNSNCDELMVFALARLHNRHVIIYTSSKAWCTLNNVTQLSLEEVHELCDLHLVYLGFHTYGELKPKTDILHQPSTFHYPARITDKMVSDRIRKIESLNRIVDSLRFQAEPKSKPKSAKSTTLTASTMTTSVTNIGTGILATRKVETLNSVACTTQVAAQTIESHMLEPSASGTSGLNIGKLPNADALAIQPRIVKTPNKLISESNPIIEILPNDVPGTVETGVKTPGSTPQPRIVETSFSIKKVPKLSFMCHQAMLKPNYAPNVNLGPPVPSVPTTAHKETPRLSFLAQATIIDSGLPLPDLDNNPKVYNPRKLCDIAYNVVSKYNLASHALLDPMLLSQYTPKPTDNVQDKDIVVLGVAQELDYNEYLKSLALDRKAIVCVAPIKKSVVKNWTSRVPHWSTLDPYSSLEEEITTDATSEDMDDTANTDKLPAINGHNLRTRSRTYHNSRSRRSSTSTVFYRDQCVDKPYIDNVNKKSHSKVSVRKEPSLDRIAAQEKIKSNLNGTTPPLAPSPMLTRSRTVQNDTKSGNTETDRSKNGKSVADRLKSSYPLFNEDDNINGSDSDTTIIYDVPKRDPDEPTPKKGKFVVSKLYSIKKGISTRKRNYKCDKCDSNFTKMSDMNNHYKTSHDPVKCDYCNETFSTVSTMLRHTYKHGALKYKCEHCWKRFPFPSDRDTHMISHRKIKMHHCVHPTCNKSYFWKGDLAAHAKVHKKIIFKCSMCKYSTNDKRNLTSHMRTHSDLKRYICSSCLKLFKYHTQLRRHLPCQLPKSNIKDEANKKEGRSSSPEF